MFEDLHWSDAATVDLLARLIVRHEATRLLVIGTLRLSDSEQKDHPIARVVRDLTLRRGAVALELVPLERKQTAALVADHLPGRPVADRVIELLWRRAQGHPLFTVAVLDAWRESGLLVEGAAEWEPADALSVLDDAIPSSLAELIEQRLEELPEISRAILDAASAVGRDFSAALRQKRRRCAPKSWPRRWDAPTC